MMQAQHKVGDEVGYSRHHQWGTLLSHGFSRVSKINGHGPIILENGKQFDKREEAGQALIDNLIAKGEMPVTIGIFIQPGVFDGGRSNRSVEYDTLSPKYSEMLLTEILPEVAKKLAELGYESIAGSPEDFTALIRSELETLGPFYKGAK